MTRQNVRERCRGICAGYNEKRECGFADNDSLLGFIDTSQGQNGTRGIAFSDDFVLMNFDGEPIEFYYDRIKTVQIISSFEDEFADELLITYTDRFSDKEIRISDFSLNKSELKRLLDVLCGKEPQRKAMSPGRVDPPKKTDNSAKVGVILPQNTGDLPQKIGIIMPNIPHGGDKNVPAVSDKPERVNNEAQFTVNENVARITGKKLVAPAENIMERSVIPAGADHFGGAVSVERPTRFFENISREEIIENKKASANIPKAESRTAAAAANEAALPPIFQHKDDFVDIVFENRAPVISETVINTPMRTTVIEREPSEPPAQIPQPRDDLEEESAERIRIQNMSPEETLSYLSQSLNEINAPRVRQPETSVRENARIPEIRDSAAQPQIYENRTVPPSSVAADIPQKDEEKKPGQLTVEPIWGDIYIKASKSLRELCESGRLSMQQIEEELDDKLLDSARAFADITADESKVPKVLIPKITELRAAASSFDSYFKMGEDIAVRAMFFMLYQMLSYADRIVETPQTKERLNDFFRRFGPAGITLSMLDMRV